MPRISALSFTLLLSSLILFTGISKSQAADMAIVSGSFINSANKRIGTISASAQEQGVEVTIDIFIPQGTHGFHLHETAKCLAPDFKTAGGHYNPDHKDHGSKSDHGKHKGDLENLDVSDTGHITKTFTIEDMTLDTLTSLAFIIHEKADDYISQPSGDAGSRIACAIFSRNDLPQ